MVRSGNIPVRLTVGPGEPAMRRAWRPFDACANWERGDGPEPRILVGVGESAQAELVCAYAAEIALRLGATMTAVHVIETTWVWSYSWDVADIADMEGASLTKEHARVAGNELLARTADWAKRAPVLHTELAFGGVAEEPCRRAEALPADLIVLGKRRRGFASRLLTRSVSPSVVAHAPCAVLVVPHHGAGGRARIDRSPLLQMAVQESIPELAPVVLGHRRGRWTGDSGASRDGHEEQCTRFHG